METKNLNVAQFGFAERIIKSIPYYGLTPAQAVDAMGVTIAALIANAAKDRTSMKTYIDSVVIPNILVASDQIYDGIALERRKNEEA